MASTAPELTDGFVDATRAVTDAAIANGLDEARRVAGQYGEGLCILEEQIRRALPHHDTGHLIARRDLKAAELARLEAAIAELEAGRVDGPIVVISCGKAKADHETTAERLYTGSYFRAMLAAAKALTTPDRVFILSARYGLLRLNELVEPYDLTLGQPGAVTAQDVYLGTCRLGVDQLKVEAVALCGKRYADLVVSAFGDNTIRPLAGAKGIGECKARLAAIVRSGSLADV